MQLRIAQQGFSLSQMLLWSVFLIVIATVGMKLGPKYYEYYMVLKNVKVVADEASSKQGVTVSEIRSAFQKRASMDYLNDFSPTDLDISKDGGRVVIDFSYQRTVPLVANVSILLDFQGSSAD